MIGMSNVEQSRGHCFIWLCLPFFSNVLTSTGKKDSLQVWITMGPFFEISIRRCFSKANLSIFGCLLWGFMISELHIGEIPFQAQEPIVNELRFEFKFYFVFTDLNECLFLPKTTPSVQVTAHPNATVGPKVLYCSANAACVNSAGEYGCQCNAGFTGNGTHCYGWFQYSNINNVFIISPLYQVFLGYMFHNTSLCFHPLWCVF